MEENITEMLSAPCSELMNKKFHSKADGGRVARVSG